MVSSFCFPSYTPALPLLLLTYANAFASLIPISPLKSSSPLISPFAPPHRLSSLLSFLAPPPSYQSFIVTLCRQALCCFSNFMLQIMYISEAVVRSGEKVGAVTHADRCQSKLRFEVHLVFITKDQKSEGRKKKAFGSRNNE